MDPPLTNSWALFMVSSSAAAMIFSKNTWEIASSAVVKVFPPSMLMRAMVVLSFCREKPPRLGLSFRFPQAVPAVLPRAFPIPERN